MEQINKFSKEVADELQYYVYRLIDPRNGQTFYVGKGKNNRVFAHVNQALKNYEGENYEVDEDQEDLLPTKYSTIQEIKNAGLEVIHIIHRYGLDKDTAFEVESAVMDCYSGLTNIQSGHYKERGSKNTITLEKELSRKCYDEPKDINYIIFKINQERINNENNDYYKATRSAWLLDKNTAEKYQYALCVVDSIVKKVYKIDSWQKSENSKRIEFNGNEASEEISALFLEKRIPEKYRKRGCANPVLYKK